MKECSVNKEHIPQKNMGCNSKEVLDILHNTPYNGDIYEIKSLGRSWKQYTCKACGCFFEIDSSD